MNSEHEPTSKSRIAPDETPEEAVLRDYAPPADTDAVCRRVKTRLLQEHTRRPVRHRFAQPVGIGLAASILVCVALWLAWPAHHTELAPPTAATIALDRTTFPELETLGTQVATIRSNIDRLKVREIWNHTNPRPSHNSPGGTQQ